MGANSLEDHVKEDLRGLGGWFPGTLSTAASWVRVGVSSLPPLAPSRGRVCVSTWGALPPSGSLPECAWAWRSPPCSDSRRRGGGSRGRSARVPSCTRKRRDCEPRANERTVVPPTGTPPSPACRCPRSLAPSNNLHNTPNLPPMNKPSFTHTTLIGGFQRKLEIFLLQNDVLKKCTCSKQEFLLNGDRKSATHDAIRTTSDKWE